ncbi:MAG: prepilin-type N-terminal cleavage/methylation domain-containing protein [Candidatus Sedimenticola sp. PURPLELP]
MKRTNAGFTLIELLVSIAIVAILAGVAIPSYQNYIKNAREAKLLDNFSKAITVIRSEAARIAADKAINPTSEETLPTTVAAWIKIIDPEEIATAPIGGGAAYAATSDDNGTIGIAISGSTVTLDHKKVDDVIANEQKVDTSGY